MAGEFTPAQSQLVALFMEALFYGVFLVSFGACLRALIFRRSSDIRINKPLLAVAIAMSIFATLDMAFTLKHNFDAFIWYTGPGGPDAELQNISDWVNVMKIVWYTCQTLIGDAMLIYRCFIVYNKKWYVIIAPVIIWIATLVCGVFAADISWNLKNVTATLDEQHLVPFVTSALILTVVQNIITTSMLTYRLWSINRQVAKYRSNARARGARPDRLSTLIRIVIESGAVYTASVIIFLIVVLCSNNAQYPVSDCIIQIIGIVFNLLIIRIFQGHTQEAETVMINTRGTASSSGVASHITQPSKGQIPVTARAPPRSRNSNGDLYPMQPMHVNVTREVVQDSDEYSEYKTDVSQAKQWSAV